VFILHLNIDLAKISNDMDTCECGRYLFCSCCIVAENLVQHFLVRLTKGFGQNSVDDWIYRKTEKTEKAKYLWKQNISTSYDFISLWAAIILITCWLKGRGKS